jgi:hypothetical protein
MLVQAERPHRPDRMRLSAECSAHRTRLRLASYAERLAGRR